MKHFRLSAFLFACLASSLPATNNTSAVTIPPASEILASLKKDHPRLLATTNDFLRLKRMAATNLLLKNWHGKLRKEGGNILQQPPSKYEIPDGLRLLHVSRRVLDRTLTLALLYRLDGDRRYVDRAWKELETAANFPDWNPRHFLDTAEMTHAFAIGYDWLYEIWTPDQRAVLRHAIVDKGLQLAVELYRHADQHGWWMKSRHNWNQVCNGGIGMGALALADEEPALAGEFLHAALKSLQLPMAEFAPDGAWAEGPGYWNYATIYNVVFLASLESALGTDFKLSQTAGFRETGLFPIYCYGPLARPFNYADCGEQRQIHSPQLFWLARKFQQPVCAWAELQQNQPSPLDLFWFDPTIASPKAAGLPPDKYFRKAEVVTIRSAWEETNALFIGFKAGDNKVNHSHLDLGSYVLDALGERWAVDLGADNYNLPGYFGGNRWSYYRLRAEGHNTLVLNPGKGPDQNPEASTKIIRFESRPSQTLAVADLTPAYTAHAQRVWRGIAMLNRQRILLQDELQAEKPADFWWFMHTPATITIHGATAILSRGKVSLQAQIIAPTGAVFQVEKAAPLPSSPNPEKQADNSHTRKLTIHLPNTRDLRLAVLFTPLTGGDKTPDDTSALKPLADW